MAKRLTNEQLIAHMMRFSDFGALSQIFIMDAVLKQAKAVAAATPEECDSPLISGAAWVGVAKEIVRRFEEQGHV